MKLLLATDLHFSDRPRDKYRFGILNQLKQDVTKYKADAIVILGDLTDKKDNHSALLVNLIVSGLRSLAAAAPVYILKGNHDYFADPELPFFRFLNHIDGLTLILKPESVGELFMVPHVTTVDEWRRMRPTVPPTVAFIHQTVSGAFSESGQRLDGFPTKPLRRLNCPVFGGDIHKPQTVGPVIYIGPPYHIRFGDNFVPRYMLFDTETSRYKELHYDCPRKWSITVREPEELQRLKELHEGDQVKIKLELTRDEIPDGASMKDEIIDFLKKSNIENFGVELKVQKQTKVRKHQPSTDLVRLDPIDVLRDFSKREKLPELTRKVGADLLRS